MAAPSSAAAMDDASMTEMSEMASMPEDMPCCPPEKPVIPDCQKACPLTAMCMAKCSSVSPLLSYSAASIWLRANILRPGSDVIGDTLPGEPPARPPRI